MDIKVRTTPSFQKWDILIGWFPYGDRAERELRPTLVVSGKKLWTRNRLVWCVMITDYTSAPRRGDIPVSDYARAGLDIPSVYRVSKLSFIELKFIDKRVGAAPDLDRPLVENMLTEYLSP